MGFSTSDLWHQYAEQIQQQASVNFDPNVQAVSFAGSTLAVDLGNADPTIINDVVYTIGNVVPQWSAAYAPLSDLITSYALFLQWIDLKGDPNPNLDSQINIAAGNIQPAVVNYQNALSQSYTAYAAYKTAMGTAAGPYQDWVTTNYPAVGMAYNSMVAAQSKYDGLMTQKYGAGFATLANAQSLVGFTTGGARSVLEKNNNNMQVSTGSVAPAGSVTTLPGQTPTAPGTTLVQSYVPAYNLNAFSTAYAEWQANSVNGTFPFQLSFSASNSGASWSDFGWSTSAGGSGFFDWLRIGGSGSGSGSSHSYDSNASSMSVKISFAGLGSFSITPGPWYLPGMVANYKDSLRQGAPSFVGEGGTISLLPYQIVVGFEPKIELTLDNATYNSVRSDFQQSTSFSIGIGPFVVGSGTESTYGDKGSVSFNDSSATITIGPIPSTLPFLLAVVSSKQQA